MRSAASVAAQAQLPQLQGHRGTYYAGAWAGYGFHEDGIRSAVAVVEAMGGSLPWVPRWVQAAGRRCSWGGGEGACVLEGSPRPMRSLV